MPSVATGLKPIKELKTEQDKKVFHAVITYTEIVSFDAIGTSEEEIRDNLNKQFGALDGFAITEIKQISDSVATYTATLQSAYEKPTLN
jgi:hypothetical protein